MEEKDLLLQLAPISFPERLKLSTVGDASVTHSTNMVGKKQLADAYNLGMRLLERSDATAKLVQLGHLCVRDWKKTAADTGYHWSGDESKMNEYVKHFLEKYRSETTRVNVSARPLGDAYAESEYDLGYVLPDFFKLDPKTLSTVVIDNEVWRAPSQPVVMISDKEPVSS